MSEQINLQLALGADIDRSKATLSGVQGVTRVRQVFPDEADDELSRMLVLDIDPELKSIALAALLGLSFVEDVELVLQRRIQPRHE